MDYKVIEAARKAKKVKKGPLAKSLGIPARRLGEILNGKSDPRVSCLESLCDELGLDIVIRERSAPGALDAQ